MLTLQVRAELPCFRVACRILGVVAVWLVVATFLAGCGGGEVDIQKVIADPHGYAGQTLQSRAIMESPFMYGPVGAFNAVPLAFAYSDEVQAKAFKILMAVGQRGSVMIKYRINDKGKDNSGRDGVLLDVWIP
jgi:hypothetical protein